MNQCAIPVTPPSAEIKKLELCGFYFSGTSQVADGGRVVDSAFTYSFWNNLATFSVAQTVQRRMVR
jgi:hypothetical protein